MTALRADALLGGGRLAGLQCDYGAATSRLDQALALYRQLGDQAGAAGALQGLGSVAREQGRYDQAIDLYTQSVSLTGDVGGVRNPLAFTHWLRGDFEQAEQTAQEALAAHQASGDAEGMASALIHIGTVQRYRGGVDSGVGSLEKALRLSEEIGFRAGVAWSLEQLGLARGDPGLLLRSLEVHTDRRDRWRMASLLDGLAGSVLAGTGLPAENPARAARLLGAAEAIRAAIGTPVPAVERQARDT